MAAPNTPEPVEVVPADQLPVARPRRKAAEEQTPGQAGSTPGKSTTAKKAASPKKTAAKKAGTAKKAAAKKTTAVRRATPPPATEEAVPQPMSAPAPAAAEPTTIAEPATVTEPTRVTEPTTVTGPVTATEPATPAAPAADVPSTPDRNAEPARPTGIPESDRPTAVSEPDRSTGVPEVVGTVDATVPSARPAPDRTPPQGARPSTGRQILDHPGYAPELLALAAVREWGPTARSWAAEVRAAYPTATSHGLARLATRRYVRLAAAGGALSTATGLLAPFAELAVVLGAQAGLVLHLAAAHGHDPTSPDRAADLLVLSRVHPDRESALAALAAAEEAAANVSPDDADEGSNAVTRLAEAGWRLGAPTVARTANWLALRLAVRRLPGATALIVALANATVVERLAARAVAHFRAAPAASGPGRGGPPGGPPLGYNQSNQPRGSSA